MLEKLSCTSSKTYHLYKEDETIHHELERTLSSWQSSGFNILGIWKHRNSIVPQKVVYQEATKL